MGERSGTAEKACHIATELRMTMPLAVQRRMFQRPPSRRSAGLSVTIIKKMPRTDGPKVHVDSSSPPPAALAHAF